MGTNDFVIETVNLFDRIKHSNQLIAIKAFGYFIHSKNFTTTTTTTADECCISAVVKTLSAEYHFQKKMRLALEPACVEVFHYLHYVANHKHG